MKVVEEECPTQMCGHIIKSFNLSMPDRTQVRGWIIKGFSLSEPIYYLFLSLLHPSPQQLTRFPQVLQRWGPWRRLSCLCVPGPCWVPSWHGDTELARCRWASWLLETADQVVLEAYSGASPRPNAVRIPGLGSSLLLLILRASKDASGAGHRGYVVIT